MWSSLSSQTTHCAAVKILFNLENVLINVKDILNDKTVWFLFSIKICFWQNNWSERKFPRIYYKPIRFNFYSFPIVSTDQQLFQDEILSETVEMVQNECYPGKLNTESNDDDWRQSQQKPRLSPLSLCNCLQTQFEWQPISRPWQSISTLWPDLRQEHDRQAQSSIKDVFVIVILSTQLMLTWIVHTLVTCVTWKCIQRVLCSNI